MTHPLERELNRVFGVPVRKPRKRVIYQAGETPELKQSLQKQRQWKEANDCAVRALHIATGLPYEKVHDALALRGRKNGRGTAQTAQFLALQHFGFKATNVTAKFYDKGVRTYSSLHKLGPKRGRFLVYTKRHVAALTAGKLHDYSSYLNSRRKVLEIYQIEEPTK